MFFVLFVYQCATVILELVLFLVDSIYSFEILSLGRNQIGCMSEIHVVKVCYYILYFLELC